MSVIWSSNSNGATIAGLISVFTVISAKTQFSDQVKTNSASQLISGIFKPFQKLLECFSGIITLASFLPKLVASYLGLSTSLPSSYVIFCQHYKYFPVYLFYV